MSEEPSRSIDLTATDPPSNHLGLPPKLSPLSTQYLLDEDMRDIMRAVDTLIDEGCSASTISGHAFSRHNLQRTDPGPAIQLRDVALHPDGDAIASKSMDDGRDTVAEGEADDEAEDGGNDGDESEADEEAGDADFVLEDDDSVMQIDDLHDQLGTLETEIEKLDTKLFDLKGNSVDNETHADLKAHVDRLQVIADYLITTSQRQHAQIATLNVALAGLQRECALTKDTTEKTARRAHVNNNKMNHLWEYIQGDNQMSVNNQLQALRGYHNAAIIAHNHLTSNVQQLTSQVGGIKDWHDRFRQSSVVCMGRMIDLEARMSRLERAPQTVAGALTGNLAVYDQRLVSDMEVLDPATNSLVHIPRTEGWQPDTQY